MSPPQIAQAPISIAPVQSTAMQPGEPPAAGPASPPSLVVTAPHAHAGAAIGTGPVDEPVTRPAAPQPDLADPMCPIPPRSGPLPSDSEAIAAAHHRMVQQRKLMAALKAGLAHAAPQGRPVEDAAQRSDAHAGPRAKPVEGAPQRTSGSGTAHAGASGSGPVEGPCRPGVVAGLPHAGPRAGTVDGTPPPASPPSRTPSPPKLGGGAPSTPQAIRGADIVAQPGAPMQPTAQPTPPGAGVFLASEQETFYTPSGTPGTLFNNPLASPSLQQLTMAPSQPARSLTLAERLTGIGTSSFTTRRDPFVMSNAELIQRWNIVTGQTSRNPPQRNICCVAAPTSFPPATPQMWQTKVLTSSNPDDVRSFFGACGAHLLALQEENKTPPKPLLFLINVIARISDVLLHAKLDDAKEALLLEMEQACVPPEPQAGAGGAAPPPEPVDDGTIHLHTPLGKLLWLNKRLMTFCMALAQQEGPLNDMRIRSFAADHGPGSPQPYTMPEEAMQAIHLLMQHSSSKITEAEVIHCLAAQLDVMHPKVYFKPGTTIGRQERQPLGTEAFERAFPDTSLGLQATAPTMARYRDTVTELWNTRCQQKSDGMYAEPAKPAPPREPAAAAGGGGSAPSKPKGNYQLRFQQGGNRSIVNPALGSSYEDAVSQLVFAPEEEKAPCCHCGDPKHTGKFCHSAYPFRAPPNWRPAPGRQIRHQLFQRAMQDANVRLLCQLRCQEAGVQWIPLDSTSTPSTTQGSGPSSSQPSGSLRGGRGPGRSGGRGNAGNQNSAQQAPTQQQPQQQQRNFSAAAPEAEPGFHWVKVKDAPPPAPAAAGPSQSSEERMMAAITQAMGSSFRDAIKDLSATLQGNNQQRGGGGGGHYQVGDRNLGAILLPTEREQQSTTHLVTSAPLAPFEPADMEALLDERGLFRATAAQPSDSTYVPPPSASGPHKDQVRSVRVVAGANQAVGVALRGIAVEAQRALRDAVGPATQACSDLTRHYAQLDSDAAADAGTASAAPIVALVSRLPRQVFTVPFFVTGDPSKTIVIVGPNGQLIPVRMAPDTASCLNNLDTISASSIGLVPTSTSLTVQAFGGNRLKMAQICRNVTTIWFFGTPDQLEVQLDFYLTPPNPSLTGVLGIPAITHPELRMEPQITKQRLRISPSSRPGKEYYIPLDCVQTGDVLEGPAAMVLATPADTPEQQPAPAAPAQAVVWMEGLHAAEAAVEVDAAWAQAPQEAAEQAQPPAAELHPPQPMELGGLPPDELDANTDDAGRFRLRTGHHDEPVTARPQHTERLHRRASKSSSLSIEGRYGWIGAPLILTPQCSYSTLSALAAEQLGLELEQLPEPIEIHGITANNEPWEPPLVLRWQTTARVTWFAGQREESTATVRFYVLNPANRAFGTLGTTLLRRTNATVIWHWDSAHINVHIGDHQLEPLVYTEACDLLHLHSCTERLPQLELPEREDWEPLISRPDLYARDTAPADIPEPRERDLYGAVLAPGEGRANPIRVEADLVEEEDTAVRLRLRPSQHRQRTQGAHMLLCHVALHDFQAYKAIHILEDNTVQVTWAIPDWFAAQRRLVEHLRDEWEEIIPYANRFELANMDVYHSRNPPPLDRARVQIRHNRRNPSPFFIPSGSCFWDDIDGEPSVLVNDDNHQLYHALWFLWRGEATGRERWLHEVMELRSIYPFFRALVLVTGVWVGFTSEAWRARWAAMVNVRELTNTRWFVHRINPATYVPIVQSPCNESRLQEWLVPGIDEECDIYVDAANERLTAQAMEGHTPPRQHLRRRRASNDSDRPPTPGSPEPLLLPRVGPSRTSSSSSLSSGDDSPEPTAGSVQRSRTATPSAEQPTPTAPPPAHAWVHVAMPPQELPPVHPSAAGQVVLPTPEELKNTYVSTAFNQYRAQQVRVYPDQMWVLFTAPEALEQARDYAGPFGSMDLVARVAGPAEQPPPYPAGDYSRDSELPVLQLYTAHLAQTAHSWSPVNPRGRYPGFSAAWLTSRRALPSPHWPALAYELEQQGFIAEITVLGIAVQHPSSKTVEQLILQLDATHEWRAEWLWF